MSDSILKAIDVEIARLQAARKMLAQTNGARPAKTKGKSKRHLTLGGGTESAQREG